MKVNFKSGKGIITRISLESFGRSGGTISRQRTLDNGHIHACLMCHVLIVFLLNFKF